MMILYQGDMFTFPRWRGGRVAEGGGLLNRYTGTTCIVGSNPIPSAIVSFTGFYGPF